MEGVIDITGAMVIEPVWREVDWFGSDYFMVTDIEGKMGLIDLGGNLVLEPCEIKIDEDASEGLRDSFRKTELRGLLRDKQQQHWATLRARSQDSLAPFAGAFSAHADKRDLTAAGLWHAEVVLLEEYHGVPAGTTGSICYYYPVTADIFDLRVEVPVTGLNAGNPELTLGVPWGMLRLTSSSTE